MKMRKAIEYVAFVVSPIILSAFLTKYLRGDRYLDLDHAFLMICGSLMCLAVFRKEILNK